MADLFELVRRTGGSRITYEVRNAFGRFRPTNSDYFASSDLADRNIQADLAEDLYTAEEVGEYLEEIPLDDIEFNVTSETTPLLESAITTANTATILAPTAFEIGTGVAIGAGTIGAGLGVGLLYPGHKNLGPGNEPDPEGIDVDDNIAFDHDIRYTNAKSQQDIVDADAIAIDEFDKDWQDTSNVHSLVGRTGIQIKKTVEEGRLEGYKTPVTPSTVFLI